MMKRFAIYASIVALIGLAGCSGDSNKADASDFKLRIDLIDDAINAIEKLDDASLLNDNEESIDFFEINATANLVNVFVATEGKTKAVAFIYDPTSGLSDPDSPKEASGYTFKWDDVEAKLNKTQMYEQVLVEMKKSTPSRFVIAQDAEFDKLTYRVVMVSEMGGEFAAYVDANGKIIGADLLG